MNHGLTSLQRFPFVRANSVTSDIAVRSSLVFRPLVSVTDAKGRQFTAETLNCSVDRP